jgi:phosphatidylglycerophosphatase A
MPAPIPLHHPAALIATWFGTGLLPRMPGTWGSLAALPFAWMIVAAGGAWALVGAAAALFALGCWAAQTYARACGTDDPPAVVVDEVAAQWLVLAVVPLDPWLYALGFALFRAADIAKPWPAGWVDRHVAGGFGIMLDDVAAAPYAMAGLWAAQYFGRGMVG